MTKLYKCTIDGKTFDSKKDLMNYIYKNYTMESESKSVNENYDKLLNAFPEAVIEITDIDDKSYGEVYVEMFFKKIDCAFYFYIGEFEEDAYGTSQFETVNDSIRYYKKYEIHTEKIKEFLFKNYDVRRFNLDHWYEGGIDDKNSIRIETTLNNKDVYIDYEFEDFELFAKKVASNFVTEIEGEISIYWDSIENVQVFTVDDIDVKNFLKSHKKAKITITE